VTNQKIDNLTIINIIKLIVLMEFLSNDVIGYLATFLKHNQDKYHLLLTFLSSIVNLFIFMNFG